MTTASSNNVLPLGGANPNDFGTKISYDPSWNGPLSVKRKAENISFTVAYYLFVCLWLGVYVYAVKNGDPDKFNQQYNDSEQFIIEEGWVIAVVLVLTAFWSVLFLGLLRVAARPVVYTCIALMFVILLVFVFYTGFLLYMVPKPLTFASFIATILILIVVIFIFITKYKFIPMTCEIIREATKAMLSFPLVFVYALGYYSLAVCFSLAFICVIVFIESIAIVDGYHAAHLYLCHLVNFLALVWINCHLYGIFRLALAGTYGTWYWTADKRELPRLTTLRFVYIAVRYHVGPVAFGSLVISFCAIIRALIGHLCQSLGSMGGMNADPSMMQAGLGCCHSFFYCIQVVVECITNMSYVHVAHHGTGFMEAARASFNLFKRNYLKVAVLKQIVEMVCVVACLVITALSVLVFWGLLSTQSVKLSERIPVLVVLLIIIAVMVDIILETLSIAVGTIFICVLEDYEMNSGSNRPYHMSNKLKDLVLENRLK